MALSAASRTSACLLGKVSGAAIRSTARDRASAPRRTSLKVSRRRDVSRRGHAKSGTPYSAAHPLLPIHEWRGFQAGEKQITLFLGQRIGAELFFYYVRAYKDLALACVCQPRGIGGTLAPKIKRKFLMKCALFGE
jgi:hypothetical protein